MLPQFSIDQCPLCKTGLCGIRICGIHTDTPHGLVVCDECEAIWQQPDTTSEHLYPDSENARCPICEAPLWGDASRWATADDCRALGWEQAINENLNADPEA
ncbi:hypothetical protein [Roseimaritima ulvae]|uniref:Uncharacterized protein n=1 Tax=Roseimaritima ulvae TaxID=980254 RepID=A0A5B9QIL3_9BACT|nr:hypothetical protein [Roseimaritima ulvae]QEG38937.1 hypothetical protein UC8_08970 [Roseimaritima ulvae]